jgi:hexokinase
MDPATALHVADEELLRLSGALRSEMSLGLAGNQTKETENNSSLKMIPSFVAPPARSIGGVSAVSLDLGGTNFRVGFVSSRSEEDELKVVLESAEIPAELMHSGAGADELFGFIADVLARFLQAQKEKEEQQQAKEEGHKQDRTPVGFTFSFPVSQTGRAAGTLIAWTKGFSTSGVVGNDVVELLSRALAARGVEADVRVLLSDTVATFAAGAHAHPDCGMGVILGTGTNACYVEHDIPKLGRAALDEYDVGVRGMVINMEWVRAPSASIC